MPTYDYHCDQCGTYELWQSIKDDALTACPKCGSKVERLFSANVGFVLKGSGFYQNEYKNGPVAAAKPEAPAASATPPCASCGEAKSCPNASN